MSLKFKGNKTAADVLNKTLKSGSKISKSRLTGVDKISESYDL